MANKDENNTQAAEPVEESAQKFEQKKPRFLRRFLLLMLILAVVLAAAVFSTMQDEHSIASLRRWLMYGETAQTQDLYFYAAHQGNRCVPFGDDLLVVNPNSIQLVQQGGLVLCDLPVNMSSPIISVGTELAAICDAGGNTVYVLDSAGLRFTHTTDGGLLCYSARVNALDQIAVTEQKSGYKAAVTVYDSMGETLFRFDSHENYLSDAAVTDDGKSLVVIAMDAQKGAFTSSLVIYDLAGAERTGAYPLRDSLILDLKLNGNKIITLCDKRLSIVTLAGETHLNYTYGEWYLHDYTLDGSDFCALLLGRYRSGNVCQLVTFGIDGEELATLDLTGEVIDMSSAGDYLCVLYSDSLVVYDRTLTPVHQLTGTDYAGHAAMYEDGTALLIAETSAWRFLP